MLIKQIHPNVLVRIDDCPAAALEATIERVPGMARHLLTQAGASQEDWEAVKHSQKWVTARISDNSLILLAYDE